MKKIIVTIISSFIALAVYGQQNADSVAYQAQRAKINAMLAQRAQKFGQYSQSLSQHTGIFGLQTKKDIRRSNDILMDIDKTDEDIFKQIKILLDFRTFQQARVQTKSVEDEQSNLGFMATINKLRDQVDKLKADALKQQAAYDDLNRKFIIALIAAALLGLLLIRLLIVRRQKPVARPKARANRKK
jgi:hypothetical protein